MRLFNFNYVLLLFGSLLLSSCLSTTSLYSNLGLEFDHFSEIHIEASKVEVIDLYKPAFVRPNVDHLFKKKAW